jgi:hypothetical protein
MATWAEIEEDAAEFAASVRERFESGTNKTIATLRQDGAPRISGTELEFAGEVVVLGMMPDSRKLHDVERDARVAVHSPTLEPPNDDPSAWPGDAKLSGELIGVHPPAEGAFPGAGYFALDITEAVLTYVRGDKLVVESWHPGRGWEKIERM